MVREAGTTGGFCGRAAKACGTPIVKLATTPEKSRKNKRLADANEAPVRREPAEGGREFAGHPVMKIS